MGQIVGLLETPYGLHFAPNVIGRLRIGPRCVVRHHRQSQNYLLFQTYVSPVFTYHGANILWKLAEKLELSYRTTRELNNIIDNDLPGPPPFECKELDIGNEHLQFFCRNTLQCIRSLYGDPDFVQHLMFAPEQHYTNDERKCCVVNEMNTGDWWWSVQVHNITYYERELTLRISLRRPLNHANQAPLFACHPLFRQDTTHRLSREDSISGIPYNWKYPKGHSPKAITPCTNPGWLHTNDKA